MFGKLRYNSNYFSGDYGQITKQNFTITDDDIVKIKNLISSKQESSYYDPQLTWRLQDNPQIKDADELSQLFVCMQLISMIAEPSQSILDKHNIKDYHMALLRSLYLDFNEDEDEDDDAIVMGYKRPFGNSDILDDVREEMVRYKAIPETDDDDNDDYELEQKVLEEFVDFLDDFYKNFEIEPRSFVFLQDLVWLTDIKI